MASSTFTHEEDLDDMGCNADRLYLYVYTFLTTRHLKDHVVVVVLNVYDLSCSAAETQRESAQRRRDAETKL